MKDLVCPSCGSVRIYITHPAKYAIEAYQPTKFNRDTNTLETIPTITYADRLGFGKAYDTKVFCADCNEILYLEGSKEW